MHTLLISTHTCPGGICSNTTVSAWFYLVWLFLRQTHITLIKCTSKCRGTHLETIRLFYGKRFEDIDLLPLPHIHHGKRTAGQRHARPDSINTACSYNSWLCSILFVSYPRHHPSFILFLNEFQSFNCFYFFFFLTPLWSVLEEENFLACILIFPWKEILQKETQKSKALPNHPSGYWPWVMEDSGERLWRWLPLLPHYWDFLDCLAL